MVGEPRPPYVEFRRKAVERRRPEDGSIYYVDVDFAFVTPLGSRDRLEKEVKDWFANLEMQVADGERFPRKWYEGFREAYDRWCKGQEIPVDGTPLRNWPVLTESELKGCIDLHMRTVEDLAGANEEAVQRLGMGGRGLRQRAKDWLLAKTGDGALVLQVDALRTSLAELERRNKSLQDQVTSLMLQVQGRPDTQQSAAPLAERLLDAQGAVRIDDEI